MPNHNCLDGMSCPSCSSEGPFVIFGTAAFLVFDDGIAETHQTEWDDHSMCVCHDCRHMASVGAFKQETAND